jgi:hypothetical protein
MLADMARMSEAFLVFALMLLVPGYVAGWSLNLLAFRRKTLLTRMTIAVPVSIGICPIISYLLWRFIPCPWRITNST